VKQELKILSLLHILNDGFRTTATTILPFVAKDLSLSLTQVGILGSSQTFIGTMFAIPSAYFAAKFGGFKLLFMSLILYSLGFLGIALSPHFFLLLIAFYAGAIGFAFFHPVSFALVTRISEKGTKGKNMGNFLSLGDIGRMIVPTLALLFIPSFGWRIVMIVLSLVAFVIYLISQLGRSKEVYVNSRQVSDIELGKRAWLKSSLVLLKDGKFRKVLMSAMGDTLASSNIYLFLPFLLLLRGIAPAQLVIFTSTFFLGSLSGKFLLGRAVDIFGNRKVFILSEFAMAAILLMLVASDSFVLLVFISLVLGVFTKGTSPVLQTLISDVTHETHYEKAFGASEMFIQIAGAITIFVSGILADHFGITVVFYMSAALAIFATFPVMRFK